MKAQIYTAISRFKFENSWHRKLSIFNSEDFFDASRKPFGNLQAVNDETLAPAHSKLYSGEQSLVILIIPMIGALAFCDANNEETLISTGEILRFSGTNSFSIVNPYDDQQINFLVVEIKARLKSGISKTAISDSRNLLQPIFETDATNGFIGIFNARQECVFKTQNPSNGIFAFVINGAFEFADRWLEARDALTVRESEDVDFEALSGNAIILILEIAVG
ncbi:MAG: hypothetical protein EOO50_03795 [Flavobacterium sp.]|uniref:pirin family protein n=1 Tax=Flavobacterium sp. TaxID=239 RepID=UPI001208F962|nr:hypothetical protein [Flavobacterium sp.]RZJ67958.1 MAG: hypothetical protein EOO50_03795 [Flavobacterium sp.]